VQGSNGEAVHLTNAERNLITHSTRAALDSAGFTAMPIIVGCGAQSTRETVQLCKEAAQAGGDYALVLPPSYYQGLFGADSVLDFFTRVAAASPIPIVVYNYPGAVSGMDLSSTLLVQLGQLDNIVACKFTCGNTGKLNRVAAALNPVSKSSSPAFSCFGGSGDFILPTLIAGGVGIIGGIANIAPKTCIRVQTLYQAGKVEEAQKVQQIVARGDWAAIQTGVVGTKAALQEFFGYGGWGRSPLPRLVGEELAVVVEGFRELVEFERTL
jgi:dihydrodipicolinate synthase/N-acetylneuraminate lyase